MTLNRFAAGFIAVCAAIAAFALNHLPPPAVEPESLVDYGRRLVTVTFAVIGPDSNQPFAGNNLACQNCHLDAGLKPSGVPLTGVYGTYPKFSLRSGHTITLAERIDECMTRSMNGSALPGGSREMTAFLAYIRSLGTVPLPPKTAEPEAAQPPDLERGVVVYHRVCAVCHQPHGLGKRAGAGYEFPPLWGPDSFNDGAGMDHFQRSVGFIRSNMPRGVDPANPLLTLQEAWDVAAFLQSRPRPHFSGR
jgi:thiosulfate dehydrogenase